MGRLCASPFPFQALGEEDLQQGLVGNVALVGQHLVRSDGFRFGKRRLWAVFQSTNPVESCSAQKLRSYSSERSSGACFLVPGKESSAALAAEQQAAKCQSGAEQEQAPRFGDGGVVGKSGNSAVEPGDGTAAERKGVLED